jgi:hypothetical protein
MAHNQLKIFTSTIETIQQGSERGGVTYVVQTS